MLTKLIGIISYLPDDEMKRAYRYEQLMWLLLDCYRFNVPIVIIAQNWREEEINRVKDKVTLDLNGKLGITGARKRLREYFLESGYDYLIMLDDDSQIRANDKGIKAYLDEIDEHPGQVGEFRNTLLKLFAISKEIYSQINFRDDINAEDGTGFEDTVFVNDIRKKFKDKVFSFRCRYRGINEVSAFTEDPYSTWYKNQNLADMLSKTHKLVD